MLTKREAIALKIETTYNVENAPDPLNDSILVTELNFSNEQLNMVERPSIKPTISSEKAIFGGTLKKITFKAEMKASGAAGTPPEIGQALRICGVDETIVASTSVAYQPVSDNHESATVYYYQDGKLKKLTGAKGEVEFQNEAGNISYASFEITGHDAGDVDSAFPSLAYNSTVPSPFVNVPFSIDGYAAEIGSFTLNSGNTISTPKSIKSADGFGEVTITKREPSGSIDPQSVTKATKDFEAMFKNGNEFTITTGVVGSTAGQRWKLDANAYIKDASQSDRDGFRVDQLTFGCIEQTTDDEWTLTFT